MAYLGLEIKTATGWPPLIGIKRFSSRLFS
jgi:hypothetical protein